MKKTYIAPETYIFKTCVVASPLAASPDPSNRNVEGNPTQNGLPSGVGETSETTDPFGDHGQDGNSNRAKGFDLWEVPDWEY